MTRLLITGVSGLLGINLALLAAQRGYEVVGWSNSRELKNLPFDQESHDLGQLSSIPAWVEQARPDAIIHCAAIANLDFAQQQPDLATRINAEAPAVFAETAFKLDIPLIHISTDSIFDGQKGVYSEEDQPNPQNIYAQSKLEGEQAVSLANPRAMIARVVFYGWSISGKRSLAEFFYNNLSQGRPVKGFTDAIFSPLYVKDLADLLLESLQKELNGIWHVFSQNSISKYAFGVALAQRFGFDSSLIEPVSTSAGDLSTRRPLNLSINTEKLQKALGHELPEVHQGIEKLYQDYRFGLREQLASYLA